MNKDSMPEDLDVFLSLLGEIDMIKAQLTSLDKSTHIALSQDEVSTSLGNSRCFNILKLLETVNADLSLLNAAYLNSAELITEGLDGKEKKTNWDEELKEDRKKIESKTTKEEDVEEEDAPKDNKVITNMLEYFKERFEKDE
tara:strand:- start:5165 stop:5590 length:426 start_codon:yes stop_codon:yes gene_type:complete